MKHIDAKLIELFEEINRREKLKIHLTHLDEIIKTTEEQKNQLEAQMNKEHKDVKMIENATIYALFASILGTRERQLEKERQEYLHAVLMYQGAEKNYNSLVEEKKLLIKSLNGLHAIEREFKRVIKQKDDLIKKSEGYPEEIITLNQRIASFAAQIKEINQAINKGNASKKQLHRIILNLKKLEQWGFLNRSPDSSSVLKRTRLAQKDMYKANVYLQKYEDQLHDISVHFSINFDKQIKNLEAFLDRFVDCLITDWVVNNKIENSIHMVNNMADTITKLNGSLEFQKKKVENYLAEDNELKAQLILELIKENKS